MSDLMTSSNINKSAEFWSRVLALCAEPLLSFLTGDASSSSSEDGASNVSGHQVLHQTSALLAAAVEACSSSDEGGVSLSALVPVVQAFHTALPSVPADVAADLSRPCEMWYAKKLPDCDANINNCLTFLLDRVASASQPTVSFISLLTYCDPSL